MLRLVRTSWENWHYTIGHKTKHGGRVGPTRANRVNALELFQVRRRAAQERSKKKQPELCGISWEPPVVTRPAQ